MIISLLEFAGSILLGIAMFTIVFLMVLDESDFNIQDYLEEREQQKTARELARIQHQREAIGTIDDRNLFADEDITVTEILREDEPETNDAETTNNNTPTTENTNTNTK